MSELLDKIKARSDTRDDCWMWESTISTLGYPIMKLASGCKLVRRVAYQESGRLLVKNIPIVSTCDEKTCVNPDHLKQSSIKDVAKKAAKTGWPARIDRRLKIAKNKRSQSTFSMDKAKEIRSINETYQKIADIYGIHKSTVGKIKRNELWVDFNSPFAGLMK